MNDSKEIVLASTCLLLSIANADDNIDDTEIAIIDEIIQDFFDIDENNTKEIINESLENLKKSTDYFSYGKKLNEKFSLSDKIDFISCIFEVAYADGELHYLEHHTIKKIANILNLHRDEIITAKAEIENFLD